MQRTDHESAPESPLIHSHPKPPLVEERNVRNNNRAQCLARRRTNPTEDSRSKKRIVRRRFGTPDARSRSDERSNNRDRPTTEATGKGNPDEICKAEDEDGDADEVYNFWEGRVEGFHVVRDLRG
jgi:hypothetical protein